MGSDRRMTLILLVPLLALMGCGKSKTGHVSGKIEVDGKPLDNGSIIFRPADGNGPTAGSKVVAGRYSADVPLGKMRVAIQQGKPAAGHYSTADPPGKSVKKEGLPPKFNEKTELEYDVQPGKQEKDFILLTK